MVMFCEAPAVCEAAPVITKRDAAPGTTVTAAGLFTISVPPICAEMVCPPATSGAV